MSYCRCKISDFMAAIIQDLKERMDVPAAISIYPTLGNTYTRAAYPIEFSNRLVRTGKNYYDSEPANDRMSTAAEELAMQLGLEKAGQDPRNAEAFNDLFGRNNPHDYDPHDCIWQW